MRTDSPESGSRSASVLHARLRDGIEAAPLDRRAAARPHAGRLLVRFDGVLDRDVAESLRGALLLVDAADAAADRTIPTSSTTTSWKACAPCSTDGTAVGTVREVVHGPGRRAAGRRTPGSAATTLVPFVREIVPEVRPAPGGRSCSTRPRACCEGGVTCASTSSRSSPSTCARCGRRCSAGRSQPGLLELAVHDLRNWTHDVHQAVDDSPTAAAPAWS